MASTIRTPFAPIQGSRLQNLTSLKNCQNGTASLTSPTKRKAQSFDDDDGENVDPGWFSPKKSKGLSSSSNPAFSPAKPVNYFLKATTAPATPDVKPVSRPMLAAKSPIRIQTSTKTPLTAPAGRSPTRKRVGILNRRRTGGPFTRVDPPRFSAASASSLSTFSIDAALSGTIPSYHAPAPVPAHAPLPQSQPLAQPQVLDIPELYVAPAQPSWEFAIYEDTEEELATNLMEHGACTLDISSDEESTSRAREERGKENVPPPDDISQTRTRLSSSANSMSMAGEAGGNAKISRAERLKREVAEGACDIDRCPLGALPVEEFWAAGCDEESVVLVAEDEGDAQPEIGIEVEPSSVPLPHDASGIDEETLGEGEGEGEGRGVDLDALMQTNDHIDIDALMQKGDEAPMAKLLEPMEKAEEGFALWESESADGGD